MRNKRKSRIAYYRRIFSAYLTRAPSHLTFWHDKPEMNENVNVTKLGEYYMDFKEKADYSGPFDVHGIPMLDYRGNVGKQYNPIAIAQYALGNYNLYFKTKDKKRLNIFLRQADWLVNNLEENEGGLYVWHHHFDWEYRDFLKSPWYSGLAQGQGISVLLRAYKETREDVYSESAKKAFEAFKYELKDGGVKYIDKRGYTWIEEVVVNPPTHILNGFIWALWGVWDYYLVTKNNDALQLFNEATKTLLNNLRYYDAGFWSLYEQSNTKLRMIASPFYHSLHIVQLKIMYRITGNPTFKDYADRWERYRANSTYKLQALIQKSMFKLLYY